MKLASVILDIPTQALDAPYTYAVPEEAGDQPIEVGCAVLVPFGPRQAVGFVIGIEERAEGDWPAGLDPAKLKGIVRAVSRPYFDEEGAACAQWLSERYIAPLSSCVRLFTPPGGVPRMVRAQGGYWRLEEPTVGEVDDRWVVPGPALADFEPRKNAVKQASIAAALERGELRVAELTAEFGAVSSPLKALEKQGVVRIEHRRRMRGFQVPSACRPTERADAAASRNARYTAVDEGSRTEVRHVSVIDPGSSAAETLADSLRQPAAVQPASLQPAGAVQPAGSFTPSPKPPLTRGQADALAAIDAARSRGAAWVCGYDHEQSMVVTAHGFAMPVKEAFAPLLKLRHWLNPVRLVPGWQSASAPALLRGIALVELAVLVVIVISRGA